eukprot:7304690-Pyramimonas_sp.AAC.1
MRRWHGCRRTLDLLRTERSDGRESCRWAAPSERKGYTAYEGASAPRVLRRSVFAIVLGRAVVLAQNAPMRGEEARNAICPHVSEPKAAPVLRVDL